MFSLPLRRITAALGLVALYYSVPAHSAVTPEARDLLKHMAQAVHNLNYQGTFVYQHDGHMQTMRIYHGKYPSGEKERLVTLTGPTREVLRDGEKVTCILPDSKSVVVDENGSTRPFPMSFPTELEKLGEHYDVKFAGTDRVAGVTTQKITIRPMDEYRYGQDLWVSEKDGLPLRAELRGEGGSVVEQVVFTTIKLYDSLPQNLLKPETKGKDLIWKRLHPEKSLASDKGENRWLVGDLPPGFEKDAYRVLFMPAAEGAVEHLVFSDGLASVSVFIEKEDGDAHQLSGLSHMGAVHAYGKRLDGHRVTVVGEVPAETVKRIAESVRRR